MSLGASEYRTLFDADPDGLVVFTSETGRIRESNRRFCELVDADPGHLRGRDVSTLATSRAGGTVEADADRASSADAVTANWLLRSDTGSTVPVEARLSAIRLDGEGCVLARVTPALSGECERDLDRKSRAIDDAPIGITISDADRDDDPLVYANERFRRLTGYSEAEILGRNCRFLQGPDTDPEAVAELREAIDAEEPVTVELRNYRRDGAAFWNRVTIAPVRDDEGNVTNYVGFQRDVTDRKRYRQELELSHHLLETVPSGVFRTDPTPDGTFEYVNPALVSLLGAESADRLRDRRVADFYVDPDERAELVDALRETDADHVDREVALETLDGETLDVMITASMTEDEAGNEHVHKVVQDISDRKARERTLERYERLVENLPIGVYQNSPTAEGTFSFVNDAMVEIFDAASKPRLRETPVRDLYADPDARDAFRETLLERGALTEEELELETLDDERIWGAVTAIARDVDGRTVFDGVVQDVTERKQFKRRLKEQRDNLDVLNQMLRHDIRNDLQLVTAYADFLADHVDDAGREYVAQIRESADHAVELTRSARDMADVMLSAEGNLRGVSLRHALEGELDDVRSADSNAVVAVDGAIPDVSVVANDMLDSVFRNLLTNAVQHNDKSIPEVRISAAERDGTAVVRIADNGPGVPDAQKAAIFGKEEKGLESNGTGIGLYLVETLVELYGGDVRVEDNDPEGAVFVVELPLAASH